MSTRPHDNAISVDLLETISKGELDISGQLSIAVLMALNCLSILLLNADTGRLGEKREDTITQAQGAGS